MGSAVAEYGTLAMLLVVMAVSVWLGTQAQKAVERGGFMNGYFLGNRGLGAWALALTATVQSGGTFMGFPSLVYTYGWIVALWIASYMVVPITGFAVLGKRFAQLSRRTGAITVPDLFDARYGDQRVGLLASILIMAFMTFLMIAQFKAGALVMKLAWPGNHSLALAETGGIDRAYLVGLAVFSITVVGYTLIGGFLASVWTDLFQSVLMIVGVVILFLAVVPAASQGGMQQPTLDAVAATGPEYAFGPGFPKEGRPPFLLLGMAISFFFVWPIGGIGSPASMVRVMACKDNDTMRRSIVLLSCYNLLIYLPLVVICICGRAVLPNVGHEDEIIPRLALWSTSGWTGGSLVSGFDPGGSVRRRDGHGEHVSGGDCLGRGARRVSAVAAAAGWRRRDSPGVLRRDDPVWTDRRGDEHQPGGLLADADRVQHHRHRVHVCRAGRDAGVLAARDGRRHRGRDAGRRWHGAGAVLRRMARGRDRVSALFAVGPGTDRVGPGRFVRGRSGGQLVYLAPGAGTSVAHVRRGAGDDGQCRTLGRQSMNRQLPKLVVA